MKEKQEFVPPEWVPKEAWGEWLRLRAKKRAPNTPYALRLAVKHLGDLWKQGFAPQQVLDNCIENGWQGIWPPRAEEGRKGYKDEAVRKELNIGRGPEVVRPMRLCEVEPKLQLRLEEIGKKRAM